jgi:hypothetical protein
MTLKNIRLTTSETSSLRKKLTNRANFMASVEYAQKQGVLPLRVQGMEKWNYPSWDDKSKQDNTPETPREDGLFDVEGHSWCDIEGFYSPTLLEQIKSLSEYVKDVWSFTHLLPFRRKWVTRKGFHGFEGFTFAKPYIPFGYIKDAWPIQRTWSGWIWTVESRSTARGDVAEEKVDIKKVKPGKYKEAQELADAMTSDAEVDAAIAERYYQLCDGIFLGKEDPTCILVDERVYPFDMKSGWSDQFVCSTVFNVAQYFLKDVLITFSAPSRWEDRKETFSRLRQHLKGSLEDVKAGHLIPAEHMLTSEERLAKIKERIQNDSSEN